MIGIDKLPTWLALALGCGSLTAQATEPPYRNPGLPVEQRVADLLGRMTLDEKLGQMVMGGRDWVTPAQVGALHLGTMLSGGDSPPPDPNNPDGWSAMIPGYQAAALGTRLGIPLLYGIDAVHGFGALPGATVFPPQVALAAAGDEDLMRRIGAATARELAAVGLYWNFAPLVA
ncbi:MAG TPA: glycoside hydrolase family 3 N-terminal domain-containing protein, partial [Chromatiaceae bacterium]|nr:glycoside hydrolase family 3 N-terminal domain-containing protein [Chromatiaceae bacterium]